MGRYDKSVKGWTPLHLKVKVVHSFKTTGISISNTQRKNPEDLNPQHRCCENIISLIYYELINLSLPRVIS